ncbi:MAG TPA: hypothetical protein VLX29_04180 [Nitrospirota bacterium]|nr:hypothetical protein [Nitrospirota bacterium]
MANQIHIAVKSSVLPSGLPLQSAFKKVTSTVSVAVFLTAVLCQVASAEDMDINYLYHLTDFSGALPFNNAKIFADREHHEVYVIDQDLSVKIFNNVGMETYQFNDDGSLGKIIIDIAVDKDGNILLLSTPFSPGNYYILKCNYRGDLMATLELKNIPKNFHANAMIYRDGHLYIADKGNMTVLVMDEHGEIEKNIDLFPLLGVKKARNEFDISGFSVDKEGDILFTVPVLFHGYRLSPDGKLASFGERGGGPGKFNIIAGIISDDEGHYFVTDKLKCTVLIFDKDFKFITQVGYRGFSSPGGLIIPVEMAYMDKQLYVSSGAHQGISVFGIGQ